LLNNIATSTDTEGQTAEISADAWWRCGADAAAPPLQVECCPHRNHQYYISYHDL